MRKITFVLMFNIAILLMKFTILFGTVTEGFYFNVSDIPSGATEVVAVVDGNGTSYRVTSTISGNAASFDMGIPAGIGYRIRVIAIKGQGTYPSVVAGGKLSDQSVFSGQLTSANITMTKPSLTSDAANPTNVQPGSSVTFKWTVNDPANFLDNANGMRMWRSEGTLPAGNLYGTQKSGTLTGKSGDDYSYSITFNAPTIATTVYYQFGEASYPFNAPAGNQAPFLVLPDLSGGEELLSFSSILTLKGDVNVDSAVNLADAIMAVMVMTGMSLTDIRTNFQFSGADVDGDGKISPAEVIFIFQKVAAMR